MIGLVDNEEKTTVDAGGGGGGNDDVVDDFSIPPLPLFDFNRCSIGSKLSMDSDVTNDVTA